MKILIAVDGSKNSTSAVRYVVEHANLLAEKPAIELLTVHLPVPKLPRMGAAISKAQLAKYYQDEGEACLAGAQRRLDESQVDYRATVRVGPIAETIVKHASETKSDLIVIGTRGMGELGKMLLGSTASKVLHLSPVPVLLIK